MKAIQALMLIMLANQAYSSTICAVNSDCSEERGLILHASDSHALQDSYQFWRISTRVPTNVMLSFKSFDIRSATLVISVLENRRKVVKHFYFEKRDNFEVVLENVNVVWLELYQIQRSNTSFAIEYFTGCQVLRDGFLAFPPRLYSQQNYATCFFVETPKLLGLNKRLYFSARNIFLQPGVTLAIYDVGSGSLIGDITGDKDLVVVVGDVVNENNFALIELECSTEVCDFRNSVFFLSYYAMSEQDIQCIEVQRQCSLHIDIVPPVLCQVYCPMFTQMLEREVSLQANVPVLRSGASTTKISESTPKPKRATKKKVVDFKCPLKEQFCQCSATTNVLDFCGEGKACQLGAENADCFWACVFTRFVVCPKIEVIKVNKNNKPPTNATSASIRLI